MELRCGEPVPSGVGRGCSQVVMASYNTPGEPCRGPYFSLEGFSPCLQLFQPLHFPEGGMDSWLHAGIHTLSQTRLTLSRSTEAHCRKLASQNSVSSEDTAQMGNHLTSRGSCETSYLNESGIVIYDE